MNELERNQAKVLKFASAYLERWDRGKNPDLPDESSGVRRICTDLLGNYFRYRGFIKIYLKELTADKKVDKNVAILLELVMTQLIFQRGISHFHAVDAAVEFAKSRFKRAAGFINGVLRNFCRNHEELLSDNPNSILRTNFDKKYEEIFLGTKLFTLWRSRFNAQELSKLVELLENDAALTVRKKKGSACEIPNFLEKIDFPDMFVCHDPQAFFKNYLSDFFVQDPATIVAAGLVETDTPNAVVGDFCAAPGGKSVFIAEKLHNDGKLFSCDVNRARLKTLKQNLSSFSNVKVKLNDALAPSFSQESFTSILLDVPCSNSGVIRKRPDVKWRFSQKKVRELTELQREIFSATVPLVKEGGSIVYSTCSIEAEENEKQVRFFLEKFPFCSLEKEIGQMPSQHNDGAYAALIRVGKRD